MDTQFLRSNYFYEKNLAEAKELQTICLNLYSEIQTHIANFNIDLISLFDVTQYLKFLDVCKNLATQLLNLDSIYVGLCASDGEVRVAELLTTLRATQTPAVALNTTQATTDTPCMKHPVEVQEQPVTDDAAMELIQTKSNLYILPNDATNHVVIDILRRLAQSELTPRVDGKLIGGSCKELKNIQARDTAQVRTIIQTQCDIFNAFDAINVKKRGQTFRLSDIRKVRGSGIYVVKIGEYIYCDLTDYPEVYFQLKSFK